MVTCKAFSLYGCVLYFSISMTFWSMWAMMLATKLYKICENYIMLTKKIEYTLFNYCFICNILRYMFKTLCQDVWLTKFIWCSTSNPKCHMTFSKTKINVNWHMYLSLNCCLNLSYTIFWIINTKFWFVTKELSVERKYLRSRMFLQTLKMVAQSIAFTSSPQRETRRRVFRVFKFNLLHKWLLIAFCLENPLLQIAILDGISIILCQSCISLGQFVCHSKLLCICAKPQISFCSHTHVKVFP
jgi:hypothetical protein